MIRDRNTGWESVETESGGEMYSGSYRVFTDGDITVNYHRPDGKVDTRSSFVRGSDEYLMAQLLLLEML